jgi:phage tail sheath protein FI
MPQYLSPGVYVEEVPSAVQPIAGVGTSTAGFIGIVPDSIELPKTNPDFDPTQDTDSNSEPPTNPPFVTSPFTLPVAAREVKLCTNFSEFKKFFGDFSTDSGQRHLAHAVYGFFNNGGTRCYVMRVAQASEITADLLARTFEPIDEIALVAAPGVTDASVHSAIVTHCKQKTQDRFAIFDSEEIVGTKENLDLTLLDPSKGKKGKLPGNSDYAAFYFPWIQVFDPATKIQNPTGDGRIYVPPSGHVAGIYARVDANRGVHKAPANEPVLGALGLKYNISKTQQEGLNPQGVNCIRDLNGNIRVWGARTLGGDTNGEWKYVNVRRLFLFLRESIDEGTQWVVFEPNTPALWAKISRNVTAFLTNVWRAGALFGDTPEQAFYVKCDAETNPPEVRDLGQVVTEIGVAVVKPAEFVIFRVSQWAGPGG